MTRWYLVVLLMLFMSLNLFSLQFDATTGSFVDVSNTTPTFPDSVLINSIPAPDGAPRGLAFDGTNLWCANSGDGNSTNGAKIYKLNPTTGAILGTYTTPGASPYGLAFDGSYLWHSDFSSGMIYKIDTSTMGVISSFSYGSGFLFDLAWDGTYLWGTFGNSDIIVAYDVTTGSQVDTIFANYYTPEVRPMGLCYVPVNTGQIWACDGSSGGASNYINQWDFSSSTWINQWQANPASYPAGMTYDSTIDWLWVSCWTNDTIYIYELAPNSVQEEIAVNSGNYTFDVKKRGSNLEFQFTLPVSRTVSIDIYNVTGRLVRTVEEGRFSEGTHSVSLDVRDLPKGVLFTSLRTEDFSKTQKIILMR
ncbi:T9SS type A sorting domain-containing protein [candidate division WOR-3 bacterium]|nr:T9SS type A sorting domain-containing protein [candidate division WOR-3 bacterium]